MRLGTNHCHSDVGGGWDFTVIEIFFSRKREIKSFFSTGPGVRIFIFLTFTFQYNGNSVETFFLAIVRAKKRNFNIIKKNKQATPLFGKKMVDAFHDFNLRCVFQFKKPFTSSEKGPINT